ncbi:MAPEG family protein [Sphingomonas sp. LT1P40]|uniref:MAPEG family protein n=1 Tax=Alteristakelama amylovorans TaxID=3096166 RepID=UPI002FC92324
MQPAVFGPVIALIGWTLVMWVWMYATRIPGMKAAKIDTMSLRGGVGADLRAKIEPRLQWPADNYNHLLEQPVLFYAICIVLALMEQGDNLNATIAWAYVVLRIAHSLIQVTTNRVIVRFAAFVLATIALMMLTVHAAMAYWGVGFH